MEVTIPVTQLRTNIAPLLKQLRENPRLVYKITHHKEVVAELKTPEKNESFATELSTEQEIATFIDAFLNGTVPRKKETYQRIRQLCEPPSDRLPYTSLDEAMTAIRGRGYDPDRF